MKDNTDFASDLQQKNNFLKVHFSDLLFMYLVDSPDDLFQRCKNLDIHLELF